MSLKLLVDEDSQAKRLVNLLRQAGHDVLTINEAGLAGEDDAIVLDYARQERRLLLTQNCKDFEVLHQENLNHPGILGIYRERQYSKNMNFQEIVKAIANLEAAMMPLANQFISLNQWNY